MNAVDPEGLAAIPYPHPIVLVPFIVYYGGKAISETVEKFKDKTCTDKDPCDQLNEDVQNAKREVSSLGKCKQGMSYSELNIRSNAWLNLAIARARRDEKCWGGGDEGHQEAQANAWKNVATCQTLMAGSPLF